MDKFKVITGNANHIEKELNELAIRHDIKIVGTACGNNTDQVTVIVGYK